MAAKILDQGTVTTTESMRTGATVAARLWRNDALGADRDVAASRRQRAFHQGSVGAPSTGSAGLRS